MMEVHGVGLAAPDPSSKHAAPGGDSYDPWGSAHGEEDRRGRGSVFMVPCLKVVVGSVSGTSM